MNRKEHGGGPLSGAKRYCYALNRKLNVIGLRFTLLMYFPAPQKSSEKKVALFTLSGAWRVHQT